MDVRGVTTLSFPKALVNAFIVDADVPTLIDTGTPGGVDKIMAALGDRALGRILLTHRHADHASNAAELVRRTGADVHVSPNDAPYVREARRQPYPKVATLLGRGMVPYVKLALPWTLEPTPSALETLIDGAPIGPFTVIATPGHTAGHVSILWEDVLFTGDAAAHITTVGPHPAADDPRVAGNSFGKLVDMTFRIALFGHGRPAGQASF